VLYVIEVKTRRYYHHRIFRSVGKQKRKHIYLATRAWLAKHVEYAHYPIRFFLCMCIREPQQKIVFREFPCYVEDN
jgi:Holliday junction resolvase-like predicted endonuclease